MDHTWAEGGTVLDSTLSLAQCRIMENPLVFMNLNFLICKEGIIHPSCIIDVRIKRT